MPLPRVGRRHSAFPSSVGPFVSLTQYGDAWPGTLFSPADQATNIKNQERIFRLAGSIDRVISRHDALQFEKYSTHGRAPDL